MARLSLKCECGWNFFIPGSTQGWEVSCPNCQQAVPIPGRKEGEGGAPVSAGELAARHQQKQKLVLLAVGGGVGLVLVAGVLFLFSGSSGTDAGPAAEEETNRALTGARPKPRVPGAPLRPLPPPPAPDPAAEARRPAVPYAENRIPEFRKSVQHHVWMCQVGGIVSEVLRLRNHDELSKALLARMAGWEAKITEASAKLAELGERAAVDPHPAPGDRIIIFAQRDLQVLRAADAAEIMARWLSTFRANQPIEQLVLLRGGAQKIELYLQFPEENTELLALAREAALAGPGTAGAPSPNLFGNDFTTGPPVSGIPGDSLKDVESRFAALPTGYRSALTDADRDRLKSILARKEGTPDDLVFVEVRLRNEILPALEKEHAQIRARAAELEPQLQQATAVDVIHFKDRRKVEGQVIEETETAVKIKTRGASITVPKADVERIERGRGAGLEFPARFAKTERKMPALGELLEWCIKNSLRLERDFVANLILTQEPMYEPARRALGLLPPVTRSKASSGPAPAPPSNLATLDAVSRAMDLVASQTVGRFANLQDVIREMKVAGDQQRYPASPQPPASAARAVSIIVDPLAFRFESLGAAQALELGQWWAVLPSEERRAFARFYGLWCASRK
jgi:hypothetical protein